MPWMMPLSAPPLDDDYLVEQDERFHRSFYDYDADWKEVEAVEEVYEKSSYEMSVS